MLKTIENLVYYGVFHLGLGSDDMIYAKNQIYDSLKIASIDEVICDKSYVEQLQVPDALLSSIVEYALNNSIIVMSEADMLTTRIMGYIMPAASAVISHFNELVDKSQALDYLYNLGIKSDYIKKTAIEKNIVWETKDLSPNLEITINLSKPEKDNKEIAKLLLHQKTSNFPKCMLCKENIGYPGRVDYPARQNLRTVPLTLGGEDWFIQYSPYAYYYKHCIVINSQHVPMKVNSKTVVKLLDFVDNFNDFFLGSNAALPIVGGSILNHEHFQGGYHEMPMMKSRSIKNFWHAVFPSVEVSELNWYAKSIRLISKNRNEIEGLGKEIINKWIEYSDKEIDILAFTDKPHNAISPIVYMKDGKYVLDLIFRNNRTNDLYPDGIFHAHKECHNIKREGIGLIEAMGLFILPGRLKEEMELVKDYLVGKLTLPIKTGAKEALHEKMIERLLESFGHESSYEEANRIVEKEINQVCMKVLDNISVFKNDLAGQTAFDKFMKHLCLEGKK